MLVQQPPRRLVGNITLFRQRTLAVEGSLADSNAEHHGIVDCLAAGDAAEAERIMLEHIESSSKRTQHALLSQQTAHPTREVKR